MNTIDTVWVIYEIDKQIPLYIKPLAFYEKKNWRGKKEKWMSYLEYDMAHPRVDKVSKFIVIRKLDQEEANQLRLQWAVLPLV